MLWQMSEESLLLKFQQIYLKETVFEKCALKREGIKNERYKKKTPKCLNRKTVNFSTKWFLCDSQKWNFSQQTVSNNFSGRGPQAQCRPPQLTRERLIAHNLVLQAEKLLKFISFALGLYFLLNTLRSRLHSKNFATVCSYKVYMCAQTHTQTGQPWEYLVFSLCGIGMLFLNSKHFRGWGNHLLTTLQIS